MHEKEAEGEAAGRRGRGRLRRVTGRLVLMAASLFAAGAAGELFLKAAGYRRPSLVRRADMLALHAGAKASFVYRGYLVGTFSDMENPVTLNREGFHDVEHAAERAATNTYRLLVVGDSYVAALSVPLEGKFTRLLESRLRREDPFRTGRYEVISMGHGNQAQEAELAYVRNAGERYRPDAVLLVFFCGNDVMENSPETFHAAQGFASRYQKTIAPLKERVFARANVLPHTRVSGALAEAVTTWYADHLHWFVPGLTRADLESPEMGVYRVPLAPPWQRAYERTAVLLAAIRDECRRQGATFLLAWLSSPQAIGDVGGEEIRHGGADGLDLAQPERWIESWCRTNGVPAVSLEPALVAAGRRRVFWRHDGHLNPAGNAAVVEPLYRLVATSGAPTAGIRTACR
jgi:hypothetical protein